LKAIISWKIAGAPIQLHVGENAFGNLLDRRCRQVAAVARRTSLMVRRNYNLRRLCEARKEIDSDEALWNYWSDQVHVEPIWWGHADPGVRRSCVECLGVKSSAEIGWALPSRAHSTPRRQPKEARRQFLAPTFLAPRAQGRGLPGQRVHVLITSCAFAPRRRDYSAVASGSEESADVTKD
jgi:hypothetical protein